LGRGSADIYRQIIFSRNNEILFVNLASCLCDAILQRINLLTNILKAYKMGHIKEPDGVDFIINGKPLTDKERKGISEFIKADKAKIARQKLRKAKAAGGKKLVTS
jgi:hypothetical protein